jgi:hypothetical protein
MSENEIPAEVHPFALGTTPADAAPRISLAAQLIARLRAGKFDGLLAVGVPATAGSALAAHEARLASVAEREAIARSLRQAVTNSRVGNFVLSSRVQLNAPHIAAAEEIIDTITLRLHSPRTVSARGMARLRQVLSDGHGPLYRYGRGDLSGRLGAALAAL